MCNCLYCLLPSLFTPRKRTVKSFWLRTLDPPFAVTYSLYSESARIIRSVQLSLELPLLNPPVPLDSSLTSL